MINGHSMQVQTLLFVCSEPHLVCLEDYPIHTVTGLVKQWLRELPDPLMTFTHYNDFLHAVGEEAIPHQGAAFYTVVAPLSADGL